jgi:hypothetical protein
VATEGGPIHVKVDCDAFGLGVVGLLCYGQNISGPQGLVSSPTSPVTTRAPAPHPGPAHYLGHRAVNRSRHVRGHGRHGGPPAGG